jgi:hypothetical protein
MRLVIVMLSGTALEPFHFLHDGFVLRFQPGHALFHLPTFLRGFVAIPLYLHQSNLQLLKACFHTVALGFQLLEVGTHSGMLTVTLMVVVMAAFIAFELLVNLTDVVFQLLCVFMFACVVQFLDLTLKVM